MVLFLSTLTGFQSMGFATFLLSLLQEVVWGREKKTPISVYLKANEKENPTAWAWYEKRGFSPMTDTQSFPSHLILSFNNEGDENLKHYLGVTKGLTWVQKHVTERDFITFNEGYFHAQFFTNPDGKNNLCMLNFLAICL